MRINKYLASSGVASRRNAEEIIKSGRVRINGAVITNLSTQINKTDIVEIDKQTIAPATERIYIALNKPKKCVTTCNDEKGRRTVLDVIGDVGMRVFPVGRLDYDTEGLLLLTNDGDFAKLITHPSSQIPKTYVAILDKDCTAQQLAQLQKGIPVDGVICRATAACHVGNEKTVQITITQGKNRQVRKMFDCLELRVDNLKRISIGKLKLENLKSGEWKISSKPFDI